MALAKLTNKGVVQAMQSWARPDVYDQWLALLGPANYQNIVAAMNEAIDNRDVVRANYIVCQPAHGDEWFDVYSPAWEAMGQSYDFARKFIGLILWDVMCNRPEQWYFHKIDKTIVNEQELIEDIQVIEYFRADTLQQAVSA